MTRFHGGSSRALFFLEVMDRTGSLLTPDIYLPRVPFSSAARSSSAVMYGVRVYLVGISASSGGDGNQAALLKQEADGVCDLSAEEVAGFLACRPSAEPPALESPPAGVLQRTEPGSSRSPGVLGEEQLTAIVESALSQMTEDAIQQVAKAGRFNIPVHLDGLLLTTATKALGGARVPDPHKKTLRGLFFAACEQRARSSQ